MTITLDQCRALVAVSVAALPGVAVAQNTPFVPTSPEMVKAMLETAQVEPNELVIDLGSGDGRIAIAAAKDFGAHAVGIEHDDELIAQARANAKKAGVDGQTEFRDQDLFETDLSRADVVTMYLLPAANLRMRERILTQMKPGSRVVSHDFSMGEWQPDATIDSNAGTIYLWIVPARVEGRWAIMLPGDRVAEVKLQQTYQEVEGELTSNGRSSPIERALVIGDVLVIELTDPAAPDRRLRFEGRIDGTTIEGILEEQPAVLSRPVKDRPPPTQEV